MSAGMRRDWSRSARVTPDVPWLFLRSGRVAAMCGRFRSHRSEMMPDISRRLLAPSATPDDAVAEGDGGMAGGESVGHALRPARLVDFVGQRQARENLRVFIDAARA